MGAAGGGRTHLYARRFSLTRGGVWAGWVCRVHTPSRRAATSCRKTPPLSLHDDGGMGWVRVQRRRPRWQVRRRPNDD